MVHAYPRSRIFGFIRTEDVLLVLVLAAVVALRPAGTFSRALGMAIPVVLAWGLFTLHWPTRVELTDSGISFHRYGRAHRFAWKDVRAVRVRRFLVRDRVLVRVFPSPPWRGRYWILDGIEGFEVLVRALESKRASE